MGVISSQGADRTTLAGAPGRYINIVGAGTTVCPTAPGGTLNRVVVNTAVASATITIYDNTAASGTKIGTITLPSSGAVPVSLLYDLSFATGLTIVTSGATDITVSWQ